MEESFEIIINSFIESRVGVHDDFLDKVLSRNLKENLLLLYQEKQFKSAKIGNNSKIQDNKLIRSDLIYWLDRKHNNEYENSFLDLIDSFVKYLNRTCYSGITGYEFHYAFYDKGSFYKRHLDQFKDDSKRAYSVIMYLNEDWQTGDGGELCIYHANHTQIITPINGKFVFFKSSELEHEVLLNFKPRLSITGWLTTN
ncbi:MAG: 2OG-Fe(II) oxygenase [Saprospiraceae bacterium]|nr:2OG-Fe(II) oxygenase [Saprospiraceae bacterium]